jgi:FtsP/CotA-like multicopper oxidase with cupredoxin domain
VSGVALSAFETQALYIFPNSNQQHGLVMNGASSANRSGRRVAMVTKQIYNRGLTALALCLLALPAAAQSFRVQCPSSTQHPQPGGEVKCQQISGGDGFATMGDGTQTYIFSFGPLSGLQDIKRGMPGTQTADVFNQPYVGDPNNPNDPDAALSNPNGAVGLAPDPAAATMPDGSRNSALATACAGTAPPAACFTGHVDPRTIMDVGVMNGNMPAPLIAINEDDELFLTLTNVGMIMRPDLFEQHTVHFHGYPNASAFYDGVPDASVAINIGASFTYYYLAPDAGTYFWHCHITPPEHLQMGMVGQLYVRPRQNKVIGDLFTAAKNREDKNLPTFDLRKACGTDILCAAPVPAVSTGASNDGTKKYAYNDGDGSTAYDVDYPIQIHGFDPSFHFVGMTFNPEPFTDMKDKYFLLNGRSYPDTVGGHACITSDPLPTCAGHSAGDVVPGPMHTQVTDGTEHFSQPLPTIINIPVGGKALLRISDLDVSEFQTLASLGIPMHVIALNARLLRDQAGNNLAYDTNSITLGGGESLDVILDASCKSRAPDGTCTTPYTTADVGTTYYLYTPNLDHLSNDAENFGGLMTEVHLCRSVNPDTKACGT